MDEKIYEVTWVVRCHDTKGRIIRLGGRGPDGVWKGSSARKVIEILEKYKARGQDGPYQVGQGINAAVITIRADNGPYGFCLTTNPDDETWNNLSEIQNETFEHCPS